MVYTRLNACALVAILVASGNLSAQNQPKQPACQKQGQGAIHFGTPEARPAVQR